MNIGELKAFIQDIPDDIIVVTHAGDHEYFLAGAQFTTALMEYQERRRSDRVKRISEDFDPEGPLDEKTEFGIRQKVLVIE